MTNRRRTGRVLFATARLCPCEWCFDWRAGDFVFLFSIIYQSLNQISVNRITVTKRSICRTRSYQTHQPGFGSLIDRSAAAKQLDALGLARPFVWKLQTPEDRFGIYTISGRIQKVHTIKCDLNSEPIAFQRVTPVQPRENDSTTHRRGLQAGK